MKFQRALYQPNLPLGKDGKRATSSKEHRELSKEAAKEGMVLLKNETNLLPLKEGSKIALFGKASFDYVKGGGGSGDVVVSYTKNLYDGLVNLPKNLLLYEDLSNFYRDEVEKFYKEAKVEPGKMEEILLEEDQYKNAANFADIAIISICRFSSEGWDRKEDDFYLSENEKKMIANVEKYFSKIVVVLNVGGLVDTSWFFKNEKIDSVLLAWQSGMEGGSAIAEILFGISNPSGKLSDTFARTFDDYPSSYNFNESEDYVNYTEDIYVGYRYFETIKGANEKVVYPFGYGLSYTDFEIKLVDARDNIKEYFEGKNEKELSLDITFDITNIGSCPGKEVGQIYGEAPQGFLGKPKKELLAFRKTRLLKSGESQRIKLKVNLTDLASYDDLGKVEKSAKILEKGNYYIYLGNSVRDVKIIYEFNLEKNIILEKLNTHLRPNQLSERMLADGSMEKLETREAENPDKYDLEYFDKVAVDGLTPASRQGKGVLLWSWRYKEGIKPFSEVVEGNMTLDDFISQMTDEELIHLLGGQPNTGVANTFGIGNMPEYGIPSIMTADGPAGLRLEKETGVTTTAFPCATQLACTWNEELVYKVGKAAAEEVKENNICVWLAPGVNIHRNPLCGRNFEYYSEDPYLAGKMGSSMVKGIQSQNIAATIKHFACNNKETNRKNSDSRVSERALREIYLRVFEIIVKEADPWCIMTSYNIINEQRTSESKELIEDILRGEWGFDGMVTTDWWTFGEHYKEAKAGNDLKMACGFPERMKEALEKKLISRNDLEKCAKNILKLILRME